jgi:phage gp36-like protein
VSTLKPITQVILVSRYGEFVTTIQHLELARACAKVDKRKINEALRGCASARIASGIINKRLLATLQTMSKSIFPETSLVYLKNCLAKMESALEKEFTSDGIDISDAQGMMLAYEDSQTWI